LASLTFQASNLGYTSAVTLAVSGIGMHDEVAMCLYYWHRTRSKYHGFNQSVNHWFIAAASKSNSELRDDLKQFVLLAHCRNNFAKSQNVRLLDPQQRRRRRGRRR